MFGQQGTGLSLQRNVMNHLALIKKSLSKKDLLHQAELVLTSKPSQAKSAELNIRFIEQNAKRKKLHQSELHLASKSSKTSSAFLNSRLAKKEAHFKRLHSAQMITMIK